MKVIDILASPWAIMPGHLEEMTAIYSSHLRSGEQNFAAIEARIGKKLERKPQGYQVIDGAAVIPIDGVIAKKMNMFSQISGGASTQLIERDFREALADDTVSSIILHADTPGGSVDGTAELAETIFKARGQKPIYTLADGLMASAGVWIGTAADKVFITSETAVVGSIGVVSQHVDYSERQKKLGIKVTDIYAGKYKRVAGENLPLSDEGREHIQGQVDYLYSIFVDRVARYRSTTSKDVLDRMADGRLFIGQQAISAGLVDGFSTLDQLISSLKAGTAKPKVSAKASTRPVATMSPDEKMKAEWERDAGLRAEFAGDYECFAAYARNRGRTRVVRG